MILHGSFDGRESGGDGSKDGLAAGTFKARAFARKNLGNDQLLAGGHGVRGQILSLLAQVDILGRDHDERDREPER